jgi:hypothetical protein
VQRDAEDLLRLFADKAQDEGPIQEVVCDRDHGRVVLDTTRGQASDGSQATRITLYLSETDLVAMLRAREDLGMDIWGEPLPVIETVARLLSIYLDESLRMHGPSKTGGGFIQGAALTRSRHGNEATVSGISERRGCP